MIALLAIDGTGPFWNNNYKESVTEYSHVRRFYNEWSHSSMKYYIRGPWTLGTDSAVEVGKGTAWLLYQFKYGGAKAVIMTGHSRGAAACIEVASYLKSAGIDTDCLLIFDAVDRSVMMGGPYQDTPLVNTIHEAHHAMRDLNTRSRESFGNCGLTMESPTKMVYNSKKVWATHGGVGGTYWIPPKDGSKTLDDYIDEGFPDGETAVTFRQDMAGAAATWAWMKPAMDGAVRRINERLGQGTPAGPYPGSPIGKPVSGRPVYGPGPSKGNSYIVAKGDSLSLIAGKYWSDVLLWPILYDTNKAAIGANPNLIQPGQPLKVPSISGMTPAQLEATRARGRQWH